MAATTRNSTLYSNVYVNTYQADARDHFGRIVSVPFKHTVVSGETGGASAGVQDKVNLCVLPAGCEVIGLFFTSNNVWASAGVNGTFQMGDSAVTDRYLGATELYTDDPGSPIATEGQKHAGLSSKGQNYRPTADTIVFGTWKVANPTVGKVLQGCFLIIQHG